MKRSKPLWLACLLFLTASQAFSMTVLPQGTRDALEYYQMGRHYMEQGQYEKAADAFELAVRSKPDFIVGYNNLGMVYSYLGKYEEAVKAFKQSSHLDPSFFAEFFPLGYAYLKLERFEDAIDAFKQGIQHKQVNAYAYIYMGYALGRLGRWNEADEALKTGGQLKPNDAVVRKTIGWINLYLGRGNLAAAEAQSVLQLKKWRDKDSPYAVLIAYLGYRQASHDDDARRILDEAVTKVNSKTWPYPVIRYLRREITAEELLALTSDTSKMTEARAYIGMELSLSGQSKEALTHLRWVKENGKRTFFEYSLALAEIQRIKAVSGMSKTSERL